jgi:hypothetical protein
MNSRPGKGKKADFQRTRGRLPERERSASRPTTAGTVATSTCCRAGALTDDARGYMLANGPKDDHGGWIEIGGEQIVER